MLVLTVPTVGGQEEVEMFLFKDDSQKKRWDQLFVSFVGVLFRFLP